MFDWLSETFSSVFARLAGVRSLDEHTVAETMTKVREALVQADVPLATVEHFIGAITQAIADKHVLKSRNAGEHCIKIVYEQLVALLSLDSAQQLYQLPPKAVVLLCGLQGSGKTTSVAKLGAYLMHNHQRKVACASIDFVRPAAVEQLTVVAQQAQIGNLVAASTRVPTALKEIMAHYAASSYDLLLLDTAGRLHVDVSLLEELRLVRDAVKPAYTLLVLDAMTGQESLSVAQAFSEVVDFDGALLSKMDSGARGGAALAFAQVLRKPVVLVGVGERLDDLERFYPDRAAKRILGMGDLDSLLERANNALDAQAQQAATARLISGEFTLQDFAQQLAMMNKLGSLHSIMRLLPGGITVDKQRLEEGEREAWRFAVILNSMTQKERQNPQILNKSRIARIARGAGVSVGQVRELLDKFEQSKQFVKLLSKNGSFRNFISR